MAFNFIFEIIINIFFGLLVGLLIGFFVKKQNFHGPDSNDIRKLIFKENNEYFRLIPKIYICPIKESMKNIVKNIVKNI